MDLSGLLVWLKICGIATVVIGWGYLAARSLDAVGPKELKLAGSLQVFECGIVGFGLVYVLAIVVSLFTALGTWAHWCFVLAGGIGALWMALRRLPGSSPAWKEYAWVAALTALVTYGTIHTGWNYDAGLYHLQAISYFHNGPLPLGIANVHDRLGFDSSWLPLSALCSGPLFGSDGAFLLNAATMVIFLGALTSRAIRDWSRASFGAAGTYAFASVLLFLSSGVLFDWFGLSPSSDLPSALSCVYAFMAFLTVAADLPAAGETGAARFQGAPMLLLVSSAVLAVTAKSSQLPVLVLLVALVPLGAWRVKDLRQWGYCRTLLLGCLMMICWMVQGLMVSGCLLFPAPIGCLGFLPWAVKPATARFVGNLIHNWAMAPGVPADQIPPGFGWLPMWHDKMLRWRGFIYIVAWVSVGLQLLGCLAVAWALRVGAKHRAGGEVRFAKAFVLALCVAFAGLLFWFYLAPDPRFGLGFLIAIPAISFSFLATWALDRDSRGSLRRIGVPVVSVLILVAGAWGCFHVYQDHGPVYVWRHEPAPQVRTIVTTAGVTVRVPLESDQCWDTAPPCTPQPADTLGQSTFLGHVVYTRSGSKAAPAAEAPGPEVR